MEQFPHLRFVQKLIGKPRFIGRRAPNPRSEQNKQNRQGHSDYLSGKTSGIKTNWSSEYAERESQNLASIDEEIIPVFLQINPDLLNDLSFDLQRFGIEIISEEDEGFIIGASLDGLRSLEKKISGFVSNVHGTAKIADLWNIIDGSREKWKPEHILSEELYAKWPEVQDDKQYKLEVSIAFDRPLGKEPDPTKQGGEARLKKYREKQIEREEQLLLRENDFEEFIRHYGEITSGYVDLEDSFGCEVVINGKGLKDLVVNYPFVFEVSEIEEVGGVDGNALEGEAFDLEILPPEGDAPEVGVIDSGIMENHRFIAGAINSANSRSYVSGDTSTADKVQGGGHGTKVAGAVLYPYGVSNVSAPYQLPCFIRNLRVLNDQNVLINQFPAALMKKIIDENRDCEIFNLSINSQAPFRKKHMSSWAAMIDTLMHERDVLFLISAGNIHKPDIQHYQTSGPSYPDYLNKPYCKLANPAQSSFALTVGSINHIDYNDANWKSLGGKDEVSAFSRIGTGIWGKIKPDVVEYGGGLVNSKNGMNSIKENKDTSPELIRSTLHGGNAYGKDTTGTSFAAPKVSYIAAELKKLYTNENTNLLRAFVAQGARLPRQHFLSPSAMSIQRFGYGLPSLERVTKNTEQRITFYNTGKICAEEAHLYSLQIPDVIRNQGDDYDILIEVTLAYTAKVRRTRQKTKSYLSTWLDWITSKIDEPFDDFRDYALKEIEEAKTEYDKDERDGLENFNWKIKNRPHFGNVEDINRNNSTLQKDWAVIKSYELPKEISLAVRAHKGWDKNKEEVPYALAVSIEVLNANIPIYEQIRIENEIEIPIGG